MYRLPHIRKAISIRAPARGATGKDETEVTFTIISIRAPARGATIIDNILTFFNPFQSALPRGERLGMTADEINAGSISIRAPARGATWMTAN